LHRPMFNCVITNVPGPQVPMYMAGHRILACMGMAPIVNGMGLIITVFSYNGVMSMSPLSSPNLMPDLDKFTRYLWETANELEAQILALDIAKSVQEEEKAAIKMEVGSVFRAFQSYLESNPNMELPSSKIFQFDVTGEQAQNWTFDLQSEPSAINEGGSEDAVCTLQMDTAHALAMFEGKLDGTAAFMQGKLKVAGDITEAINFGKVLGAFPREEILSRITTS